MNNILFLSRNKVLACFWHGLVPPVTCFSLSCETFLHVFILWKIIIIFHWLISRFCWSLNIQKGVNIPLLPIISTFNSFPLSIIFCILLLVMLKFYVVIQCVLSTRKFWPCLILPLDNVQIAWHLLHWLIFKILP